MHRDTWEAKVCAKRQSVLEIGDALPPIVKTCTVLLELVYHLHIAPVTIVSDPPVANSLERSGQRCGRADGGFVKAEEAV